MNRRPLGIGLVAVGALLVAAGVVLALGSDDGESTASPADSLTVTTVAGPESTDVDETRPSATNSVSGSASEAGESTAPAPTATDSEVATTPAPTATSPTTTLPPATTATPATPAPTTIAVPTTTVPPPSITDFVAAYAAAITSADVDFLADSLLPDIRAALGESVCRAWIEREILGLNEYRLSGDVGVPLPVTLTLGDAQIDVDAHVEAPVSFTFQGQPFDAVAAFAIVGDRIFWIGECR